MGPRFFETQMGRVFYEGTLPRIAKALERIATSLEAQDKRLDLGADVPKCIRCGAWAGMNHRSGSGCPVGPVTGQDTQKHSRLEGENEQRQHEV